MKSVVIFSGGQDSTTCLLSSLKENEETIALSFDYGQKNKVELECADTICSKLGVKHTVLNVSDIFHSMTAAPYLSDNGVLGGKSSLDGSLPSTWIPNRNMMFIVIAYSLALKLRYDKIVTGVNSIDYSGYPDCRPAFIDSLRETLALSVPAKKIIIDTPLINLTKAQIWQLANSIGGLEFIKEYTHTCYNGDHTTRNEWGYGCGECDSCRIRKSSYEEFLLTL